MTGSRRDTSLNAGGEILVLEADRVVEAAALRTPGSIDIGVVRVNVVALVASKDVVLAGHGPKAPLPLALVKGKQAKRAQRG